MADGALIDFDIPAASVGQVLLAVIARVGAVYCSDDGWTKVVDGIGSEPGDTIRLDAWAHVVDGDEGDTVSFLSLTEQELQGAIVTLDSHVPDNLVEATAHVEFTSDTSPNIPTPESEQAINELLCVWSAGGSITFTAPSGFVAIDTYTSSEIAARSILVAARTCRVVGTCEDAAATASPAATGRAFTLVLRPLLISSRERFSGHALHAHPEDVTNASTHATEQTPVVHSHTGHRSKT